MYGVVLSPMSGTGADNDPYVIDTTALPAPEVALIGGTSLMALSPVPTDLQEWDITAPESVFLAWGDQTIWYSGMPQPEEGVMDFAQRTALVALLTSYLISNFTEGDFDGPTRGQIGGMITNAVRADNGLPPLDVYA